MTFPAIYQDGGQPESQPWMYMVNQGDMNDDPTVAQNVPFQPLDSTDDQTFTRGEEWSSLLSCITSPLLRLGFLIQLLTLIFGFVFYHGHGGTGAFSFDLFSLPESLRSNEMFTSVMIMLESAFLVGCICISSFQIYVADSSKLSRGFRAGSKMLGTAALLDTIVVAFRLMQSIYAYQFLGARWWLKYTQTNTDWCIFYFATFVHSIAQCLYGLAAFYMEAYHDEGTYEECSWIVLFLFMLAGVTEFLLSFTGVGNCYTVFQILALLMATVWAFSFEPLLHFYSPAFHDRNIEADLNRKAAASCQV